MAKVARQPIVGPLTCLLLFSVLTGRSVGQTPSPWRVETVDGNKGDNLGKHASLAVDKGGNLHVAYYDETEKSLRYAFRGPADKAWSIMEVDKPAGTFVSVAVDGGGHPHFAYNSPFETGLHYATWDGKRWHKVLLDSEQTDHFLSMQLDSSGNPHISYYREVYPDRTNALYLKYAHFDGKTWYVETVDRHMHSGKFNSLALDAAGNARIAYSQVAAGDLRYAKWDGSQWQFGTADARRTNNDYVGIGNSIGLDSMGNMCIAYFDATKGTVKYAWQRDGRWQTEVVDQLSGLWIFNDTVSLKLDSHDIPHIAYYDHGFGGAKYAFRDANGWHVEVVEKLGHVGGYPSLAIGPDAQLYMAYYDMNDGQLRVARREAATLSRLDNARNGKP
jgi:catechol 2,3-dioxygenase-like lactoylglutathione lyase family enzyme